MHIYIPSLGRPADVFVGPFIPPGQYPTTLVVSEKEYPAYKRNSPCHIEVITCPYERIAKKRQWILENSDDDIVMFVDDDLKFFRRPRMNHPRLVRIRDFPSTQRRMWQEIEDTFLTHAMVGVSSRGGNNFINVEHKDCAKINACWGVDRRVLSDNDIRIDTTPIMEDYQVALSLLTRGYPNRVFYRWAWDQKNSMSQSEGGCSLWRTPEIQNEGAEALHDLFPQYTKLTLKHPKTGWFQDKPRVDITVQWKKAFTSHQ
jgi:hypothetical protein